jgi:SAM-dependent methyltransferase
MGFGFTDKSSWLQDAQPGELLFHKHRGPTDPEQVAAWVECYWKHLGYSPDSFVGKTLCDMGCGPVLFGAYFHGLIRLIAVDPLADKYRSELTFTRLHLADAVFSVAAEQLIEDLAGNMDVVVSRNALDHIYDFDAAIGNISRYLKEGGLALLHFDLRTKPDSLHPLCMTSEYCEAVYARNGLVAEHKSVGAVPPNVSFGGGLAMAWRLRKS